MDCNRDLILLPGQDHAFDCSPKQLLLVAHARGRGCPNPTHILRHATNAGALGVAEIAAHALQMLLGFSADTIDESQSFVPPPLQIRGHKSILGIDSLVARPRAGGVVFGPFRSLLPVSRDLVSLLLEPFQRLQRHLDGRRLNGLEKQADHSLLDATATQDLAEGIGSPLAPKPAADKLPEPSLLVSQVRHGHSPSTPSAVGQSLQESGALSGRASVVDSSFGVVGHQTFLVALESLPADQAIVVIADQDRLVPSDTTCVHLNAPVRLDLSYLALASVDVRARVCRMDQDRAHRPAVGLDPANIAARPTTGQLDSIVTQPQCRLPRTSQLVELVEDQPKRIDDLLVRRDVQAILALPLESDRRCDLQLASLRLVQRRLMQAFADGVPLELRDRALEPQHHSVIEQRGVVDAVLIAQQGIGQTAEPNQTLPVGIVARQPRSLDCKYDPDLAEPHVTHDAPEAGPVMRACTRVSLVLVDHHDLVFAKA